MANDSLSISDRPRLLSDPSLDSWKNELSRIFAGEREGDIQRVGKATDYVAPYLATKANRAIADRLFREALEYIFQDWEPQPDSPEYVFRNALDLAEKYRPALAVPRILTYLEGAEWFGPADGYEEWRLTVEDTHLQALRILKKAFQGHGMGKGSLAEYYFNAYCALLRSHVSAAPDSKRAAYAAFAVAELIRLQALAPHSEIVRQLLDRVDVSPAWKEHVIAIRDHWRPEETPRLRKNPRGAIREKRRPAEPVKNVTVIGNRFDFIEFPKAEIELLAGGADLSALSKRLEEDPSHD